MLCKLECDTERHTLLHRFDFLQAFFLMYILGIRTSAVKIQ
jgi:hypothetical protein